MAMYHVVWPGWPPYCHLASEYAVVMPMHHSPCFDSVGFKTPRPKEYGMFLLDRSIFELVHAHKYLGLNDRRLLSWYLRLSPEDRAIILDEGGLHMYLQRHPALEVTLHHVYVKYLEFELIPSNLRDTLTLFGWSNSRNGSQSHPAVSNRPTTQEPNDQQAPVIMGSSQLNEQGASWHMSRSSAAMYQEPAALKKFSLYEDLERRGRQPELWSQTTMTQGQSAKYEASPLQLELPTVENDLSAEYYSFNNSQMADAEYSDGSIMHPVQPEPASSHLDPVEENGTKEVCQMHVLCGNESPVGGGEASFGDESDNFHSIMENDQSILVCEGVKSLNNGVDSGPVTAGSETATADSETFKSGQTNTEEHSLVPSITSCDIISTELALCTPAATQTEAQETVDKHLVTEVHMSDLDYIAEEFIKLKKAQEKWREQKEKMVRKERECIQRAQQAELCLLALHYSMCQQHYWKLYYTSTEGGQLTPMPKNPSSDAESVLQKLERDYNQMKDEILAGVPLEQLKPLSVDSEIITGGSYVPSQIISGVLTEVPSWSSQVPNTSGEEKECPDDQSSNDCQRKETERQIKLESTKATVPQDRDTVLNAHEPEEKQTTAPCQELTTCEAWYDAEENLQPAGPAAAAEMEQDPAVIVNDKSDELPNKEVKSSLLCVPNLPSDVTESDVMSWFEKYQASEVSISALTKDLRVAIVMVSGPQCAEAAVKELHGCSKQGHTLHVEHINRAASESQTSASISGPESSQDAKPQTSKSDSTSNETKLMSQPVLSSSIKSRTKVYVSPTAKGTFVPQHFGTMGSFDTLMAALTQRHPDVERQRIVDALMELKAKHRGVLSGLPLRTIREMTSELLTRPAGATKS